MDSSAIIEYLKGNKNAREAVDKYDEAYISILTVYEVLKGRTEKESIMKFLSTFSIAMITEEDVLRATRIYKALKDKGKLVGDIDVLIAAQAINRGLTLVTKDRDFLKVKEVVNELELELIT